MTCILDYEQIEHCVSCIVRNPVNCRIIMTGDGTEATVELTVGENSFCFL